MGTGNGRKAGWIFCILGWILAAAVFAFLPKQIPMASNPDDRPAPGQEQVYAAGCARKAVE